MKFTCIPTCHPQSPTGPARMHLELIDDRIDLGLVQELAEVVLLIIADTNGPELPGPLGIDREGRAYMRNPDNQTGLHILNNMVTLKKIS